MALFDSDFLNRLEYLSLVCKRVFKGQLSAQRRTHELGAGIAFAEHREYTHGDDSRYLDWHVYARLDQMLLKRFEQEQDLHVYVLLDCSRSMSFGEVAKFDHARRLAAAVAYIALADFDRVAVLGFGDADIRDFPLARGKGRILALLKYLEGLSPAGATTDLLSAATTLVHRNQRPGPVMVISDLYDPGGYERGIDLLRYHRYEPHVIRVYDPLEADPLVSGDFDLIDIETELQRKVTVTPGSIRRYRRLYDDFVSAAEDYCRRYGLRYTAAPTDISFDDLVLQMMRTPISGVAR